MKQIFYISFLLLVFSSFSYSQYCTPTYSNLCTSGDFINNFSTTGGSTNIANNSSGCSGAANNYFYYSGQTVTQTAGSSFDISVQSGSSWGQGFRIWIDWNADNDFLDAGEDVWNSGSSGTSAFTGTITIPGGTTAGAKRMRVRCSYSSVPASTDDCTNLTYGETEDYIVTVGVAPNMTYVSCTAAQPTTSTVGLGATNQEVIRLEVVTTGSTSPLNLTQIITRIDGTTTNADIANAKIFYTGTSSTFATTTQFSSTIASPPTAGVDMTFNGSQTLAEGTNYFWLSYDIQAGATVGNVVDGTLQQVIVGATTDNTPITSAPAGSRTITGLCTHTARLTDTYGDGWNGGTVTISVNGTPVHTNITLASGSGPADFPFNASTGDIINITETAAGSFPSEMRVQILNECLVSISGPFPFDPSVAPGTNVNGGCSGAMSFSSSTTTQANTSNVLIGSSNQEIIGVQIVTTGCSSPFDLTQFQINMTGTTSTVDVSNIDVYYTGTSSTFATTTLFGSVAPGAGTLNVNGSQTLAVGTNYFWVVYDISGTATGNNFVDAQCTQITMNGGVGNKIPTLTNPAGNRLIEPPMAFSSSTCTQGNTANIVRCTGNNSEIIGIQVVTTGSVNPIDITNLRVRTTGSSDPLNDISNIDVYYTGTSSTFATTTLFGNAAPAAVGVNINISGTQTLASGTNYFWVVYDINSSGTVSNVVDALCNQITVATVNYVPTTTAPAGTRTLADCPGNSPCTAYTLTPGCSGGKVNCDNTDMTDSGIAVPSCASYAGGDIWCVSTVPATGEIKVETYSVTLADVGMSVYTTSGGCSGTLTEEACDDNSGFGNMSKITLTGLTPGATIYVRSWDKNNDEIGTYEIDASDLSINYCVTNNGIDLGSGCAQLTAASNGQLGSIWDADDKFDFTTDFLYDFTINLGSSDAGADGICFVIQNDPAGLSAAGGMGGSMGSSGISNSLIIEIDTYLNTEDRNDGLTSVDCWSGSPDPDHIDLWLNGVVNPGDCSSGARVIANAVELIDATSSLYNIENGSDHILRINYVSATQTITGSIMNTAKTFTYGTVTYGPIDPMTLFGTNSPYFGFTGSTGGLNNQQTACLAPTLILPVELTSFEAFCRGNEVELKWTTASEINNDFFNIEKSIDGINWSLIGSISGNGNSNRLISYKFTDNYNISGKTFYRLKQVDYDGQHNYSESILASCESSNPLSVYVYPDLENKNTTINFSHKTDQEFNLDIINNLGMVVQTCKIPKGIDKFLVPENSKVLMGTYVFSIYNENERFIEKHLKY